MIVLFTLIFAQMFLHTLALYHLRSKLIEQQNQILLLSETLFKLSEVVIGDELKKAGITLDELKGKIKK